MPSRSPARHAGRAQSCLALDGSSRQRQPGGSGGDDVARAATLIATGEIVAIKGLGGYHLACDATNAEAVARLRRLKRRDAKPFALMARDWTMIRRYCTVGDRGGARAAPGRGADRAAARRWAARRLPERRAGAGDARLHAADDAAAPLLMEEIEWPAGDDQRQPLGRAAASSTTTRRASGSAAIAEYALMHEREIANRVDDSVRARHGGQAAPAAPRPRLCAGPDRLPAGFADAPEILAMGGELKATFCLVKDGQAILSQHKGDLENAATFEDYRNNQRALCRELFDHAPAAIVDRLAIPNICRPNWGRAQWRKQRGLPLVAGAASSRPCRRLPRRKRPPARRDRGARDRARRAWMGRRRHDLGRRVPARRLSRLPAAGTAQAGRHAGRHRRRPRAVAQPLCASRAPRSAATPWQTARAGIELMRRFAAQTARRARCDDRARAFNSPRASSCGRLFDAVAAASASAAIGRPMKARRRRVSKHCAEAALGSITAPRLSFRRSPGNGREVAASLTPQPMWRALLRDLERGISPAAIAAAFHDGLAQAIARTAARHCRRCGGGAAVRHGRLVGRLLPEPDAVRASSRRDLRPGASTC